MKTILKSPHLEYIFLLLLLCASIFLFTGNLGNHYLWQDEAQTALISKTILTEGVPRGYDGKNFFSQEIEAEYGKNFIWKWHTWLPFYFVAGFFQVFGINEFSARLPFALLGIGTVVLTFYFCKALWKDKKIAYTASFLLLTCIPFLLLSRQCRYYSMSAFFSLWALLAYLKVLESKRHARWNFVLASTLLFHTHYVYCATLLGTVIIHALIFHRNRLKIMITLSVIITLLNAPWILWLSGMKYGDRYGLILFKIEKLTAFARQYFRQITLFILPLNLLIVVPLAVIGNYRKTQHYLPRERLFWQRLLLLVFFIVINFIILVIACPWPFLRYLAPIIPLLIIILAMLIVSLAKLHIAISIITVAVLLCTGPLKDFLYEITHDYDGPIEGICKYLNEHADDDDIVLIDYGDMPLKFYTDFRIVGGLTGEDLSIASDPDWIILRKYLGSPYSRRIREFIAKLKISPDKYDRILLDYPDIKYENREELPYHHFRTVVNEDRVMIHRKK